MRSTWLRVPLGKLATERTIPLDAATLAALDEWAEFRGPHRPTPHPRTRTLTDFLRHTWATGLANAGMSLQALMALLGHVTPQMTIRYATLASPTLRTAYDQAMGKMRRQFTLTPVGKPVIPDKMSWLNSEMLKTRVTHGYCSRHAAAGACPLRQHLRDLRQPRHRPRISRRDQQPDHRRPEPARRRTSPKLGQRSRPPRPRRRLPHRSPA
jgi:hypothetical protein